MNIKSILLKSIIELRDAGSPTPELDARVLLEEAVKKESAFVFSHPKHLITNSQYSLFRSFIRRRKKGEPVAYILGHKEFYGHNFLINKNVLIPRPETEWLVEKGIEFLSRYQARQSCHSREGGNLELDLRVKPEDDKINILDIGTGSGCIIISLTRKLTGLPAYKLTRFVASDLSSKALRMARKNAKLNDVENIKFYISDLFSNRFLHKKFDLMIANLPYVPRSNRIKNSELRIKPLKGHPEQSEGSSEAILNSIAFEPKDAIFAGDNGMAIIKRFLVDAKERINDGGMILLEADSRNAKKIFEFAKKHYPNSIIELKKDLAGLDRYIIIKK